MTPLQMTLDFISNAPTCAPPFHPITMQFAADYAGVEYRDFCLAPEQKVRAMTKCADDFGLDWVTVPTDPYTEAEAFGLPVEYPENSLPYDSGLLIKRHFRRKEACGPEAL